MKLHPGINTTSIAGDGLQGLPGLLMTIAFVFIFAGIFVSRESSYWFMAIFLAVETGAGILYILAERTSRKESEQVIRQMHRIND
jgi:hypothetical protein